MFTERFLDPIAILATSLIPSIIAALCFGFGGVGLANAIGIGVVVSIVCVIGFAIEAAIYNLKNGLVQAIQAAAELTQKNRR